MRKTWIGNSLLAGLGVGVGVLLGAAFQIEPAHACSCLVGESWQLEVTAVTGPESEQEFWTQPELAAGHGYSILDFSIGDESHCRVKVLP